MSAGRPLRSSSVCASPPPGPTNSSTSSPAATSRRSSSDAGFTGPLRIFLVDEPTKGVDVAGKAEILRNIRLLAAEGVGVVVASSELDEVAEVADRVVVLREGRVVAHIDQPTTGSAILAACFDEQSEHAA